MSCGVCVVFYVSMFQYYSTYNIAREDGNPYPFRVDSDISVFAVKYKLLVGWSVSVNFIQ